MPISQSYFDSLKATNTSQGYSLGLLDLGAGGLNSTTSPRKVLSKITFNALNSVDIAIAGYSDKDVNSIYETVDTVASTYISASLTAQDFTDNADGTFTKSGLTLALDDVTITSITLKAVTTKDGLETFVATFTTATESADVDMLEVKKALGGTADLSGLKINGAIADEMALIDEKIEKLELLAEETKIAHNSVVDEIADRVDEQDKKLDALGVASGGDVTVLAAKLTALDNLTASSAGASLAFAADSNQKTLKNRLVTRLSQTQTTSLGSYGFNTHGNGNTLPYKLIITKYSDVAIEFLNKSSSNLLIKKTYSIDGAGANNEANITAYSTWNNSGTNSISFNVADGSKYANGQTVGFIFLDDKGRETFRNSSIIYSISTNTIQMNYSEGIFASHLPVGGSVKITILPTSVIFKYENTNYFEFLPYTKHSNLATWDNSGASSYQFDTTSTNVSATQEVTIEFYNNGTFVTSQSGLVTDVTSGVVKTDIVVGTPPTYTSTKIKVKNPARAWNNTRDGTGSYKISYTAYEDLQSIVITKPDETTIAIDGDTADTQ